jgi:protein-tyrosine phosphatase
MPTGYFPKVDATRVASKLYIGSVPMPRLQDKGFDVVVLCAKEKQNLNPDVYTIKIPLDDGPLDYRDYARAVKVAMVVTRFRLANKRVLITCRMGVNRSALVAALSMMQLERMSARNVIARIRGLRGADLERLGVEHVPLSNRDFEEALYHFERLALGR